MMFQLTRLEVCVEKFYWIWDVIFLVEHADFRSPGGYLGLFFISKMDRFSALMVSIERGQARSFKKYLVCYIWCSISRNLAQNVQSLCIKIGRLSIIRRYLSTVFLRFCAWTLLRWSSRVFQACKDSCDLCEYHCPYDWSRHMEPP